jgi:acetyl-CoA carboxylase, biotin carboxylase subunit
VIRRVLLCCRGEIALRFVRTCQTMRIETVVLFTEDDAGADFMLAADHAIPMSDWHPSTLVETVINAARVIGADAVAPGYGPLAENADFAHACLRAGLIFVGPNVNAIRNTGDKIAARLAAQRAGVPVIPGSAVPDDMAGAAALAQKIGFPVLLKAALGGGGRGIRVAESAAEFPAAFEEVRREAALAFGSRELYIEKFLGESIRHIEVQVLGDRHGHLVHLGTRSCSVQRRRQKIVEEAPAPFLPDALRGQLHDAALALAREVRYDSAGTAEFLVTEDGQFYFIEMNARIQVEHPVSEAITGIDIVASMLSTAAGETLELTQEQIRFEGHAIEFRVCAEDAYAGFLPTGGRVTHYRVPEGPGIRIDAGVRAGASQSARFDSLCLKLIVCAREREAVLRRADAALDELTLAGFSTNLPVHRWLLSHPRFSKGDYDLSIMGEFTASRALPIEAARLMHAAVALARHLERPAEATPAADLQIHQSRSSWVIRNSPWQQAS